jgi:hypothetical protein
MRELANAARGRAVVYAASAASAKLLPCAGSTAAVTWGDSKPLPAAAPATATAAVEPVLCLLFWAAEPAAAKHVLLSLRQATARKRGTWLLDKCVVH